MNVLARVRVVSVFLSSMFVCVDVWTCVLYVFVVVVVCLCESVGARVRAEDFSCCLCVFFECVDVFVLYVVVVCGCMFV